MECQVGGSPDTFEKPMHSLKQGFQIRQFVAPAGDRLRRIHSDSSIDCDEWILFDFYYLK
jgi:hypothetical protein